LTLRKKKTHFLYWEERGGRRGGGRLFCLGGRNGIANIEDEKGRRRSPFAKVSPQLQETPKKTVTSSSRLKGGDRSPRDWNSLNGEGEKREKEKDTNPTPATSRGGGPITIAEPKHRRREALLEEGKGRGRRRAPSSRPGTKGKFLYGGGSLSYVRGGRERESLFPGVKVKRTVCLYEDKRALDLLWYPEGTKGISNWGKKPLAVVI